MKDKNERLSRTFFWRRIHSLMGLWLVIFLIEHIVTNSQSALLIGENGAGFVHAVNFIKNLPYLPVIEIGLLAVPIAMHAFWGIRYIFTAKYNNSSGDGSKPSLPEYGRNRAYTWQRITSWVLLIGIIAHVGYMRFYRYPVVFDEGVQKSYFVRVSVDPGLYTVAERLGVSLYSSKEVTALQKQVADESDERATLQKEADALGEEHFGLEERKVYPFSAKDEAVLTELQKDKLKVKWVDDLSSRKLSKGQVMAVAPDFGTATLLTVRDAFKSPFESVLYTIFVLAAAFHAFNGLWTFMISWGIVLKMRSQRRAVNFCIGIMALIAFLGLASVWGTYWINLKS